MNTYLNALKYYELCHYDKYYTRSLRVVETQV